MTQEELDLLMKEGIDELKDDEEKNIEEKEEISEKENEDFIEKNDEKSENQTQEALLDNFKVDPMKAWPPPPPTEDHKVVGQLDDVTKDSEVKATEIFEKLEHINDYIADIESKVDEIEKTLDKNIEIFDILSKKFPEIEHFCTSLEYNNQAKECLTHIRENALNGSDEIMMIMDIMQYQDIHRQKIERVINVMRALSKYMNTLFEGKIEDSKRVGSAVHIAGDNETENVVTNEEIEELIANLGKK